MKFIVFELLAKILLMKLNQVKPRKIQSCNDQVLHKNENVPPPIYDSKSYNACLCQPLLEQHSQIQNKWFLDILIVKILFSHWWIFSLDLVLCLSVMHCSLGRLSSKINDAIDIHNKRQEEDDLKDELKMEWQLCALVIDR